MSASSESHRVAIVTGGGSGIRLAVAQRLAKDGLRVAIFDLDGDAGAAAAAAITSAGGSAIAMPVDVCDRTQIDAGVVDVCDALGQPTVLVNNAGLDGF